MKSFISKVVLVSMFVCGSAVADTQEADVLWFVDASLTGGTSYLTRTADTILVTVDVRGLPPGDVVTLWWVVFNNPGSCMDPGCSGADLNPDGIMAAQIAVGNATGNVVKSDGTLELGAILREGMNEDGHQVLFNAGPTGVSLLNAGGASQAEVHLVVQLHGHGRGGKELRAQLAEFEANCTPSCVDVQFAVHLP
jgi:hypothetical protein